MQSARAVGGILKFPCKAKMVFLNPDPRNLAGKPNKATKKTAFPFWEEPSF